LIGNDRNRFVWILSVLLLGGFLLTSLVGYRVAHESLSAQIRENALPLTSDNIYSEIQQDLLRPIFISSLMAQDTFVRDWVLAGEQSPEALIRYLKEIQEKYHTVSSFFVSEKTRNYYHPTGILKQVSENNPADAWYFRTRDLPQGQDYEVNIDTDTADRSATNVFVNYRVYDYQGEVIGVGGVGLAVELVQELISVYQQRYGRRVYFIDRRGEVTLQGEDADQSLAIRQRPGIGELATQILTSPGGSYEYFREGRLIYLNSRMIPEFDWYLMVEQEADPSERPLINSLIVNLLVSVLVTGLVLFLTYLTFGRYQRRLERMATYDKLTGALNRQVFEAVFEKTLQDAKRTREPVSVVILDIDHFKSVNDTHGHRAGDHVLWKVAGLVQQHIRESDSLCRWGGEEFLVLLPHCDRHQAAQLAERMRAGIAAEHIVVGGKPITTSASFGVAQHERDEQGAELIERADNALYQAKRGGRNRVVSAPAVAERSQAP